MSVRIVKGRRWRKRELIESVMSAFEKLYPDYYRYLLEEMPKLRAVSKPSYTDPQGRVTHVSMKVPTVIWLFLQQLEPDWGKDSDDVALFTQVCRELNGAAVPEGKSKLWIPKETYEKIFGKDTADEEEEEAPEAQS